MWCSQRGRIILKWSMEMVSVKVLIGNFRIFKIRVREGMERQEEGFELSM